MLLDVLHGFIKGSGTDTETLDAKMAQQLAGIAHDPLFQVFLYVQKAYNYLDQERCLELPR